MRSIPENLSKMEKKKCLPIDPEAALLSRKRVQKRRIFSRSPVRSTWPSRLFSRGHHPPFLLATSTSYFHVTSMCSLASALGEIESVDVTVAAESGKRGNPLPSKGQGSRDPTRVAWVAKRRRERERREEEKRGRKRGRGMSAKFHPNWGGTTTTTTTGARG